jgi:RNA polymerase sigma-70 factor (ECF subfamily)
VAAGELELPLRAAVQPEEPDAETTPPVAEARIRELVDVHLDFVWRLVRRLGVPEADADDAAQQVFWVAAQKLERISAGSERAFLGGTALRVASDMRRARRRRPEEHDVDVGERSDPRPGPDELVEQRREIERLDRLLACLPDKLRTTFVLYELEEMSVPEIAELLELPIGTVASRLRLAREAFRNALAEAKR